MFKFEPVGRYLRQHLHEHLVPAARGEELLEHAEERLGVKAGGTTADGLFTLEDVECIAACTEAPCLQVNYRYRYRVTTDEFDQLIDDLARRPPRRRGPAARHAGPRAPAHAGALGGHRHPPRPRWTPDEPASWLGPPIERASASERLADAGGNGPILVTGMVPTGPAIVTSRFDVRRRLHPRRLRAHGRLRRRCARRLGRWRPPTVHDEVKDGQRCSAAAAPASPPA